MKKIFYFLMAMPLIMALNSCNEADNTGNTTTDPIKWGDVKVESINQDWIRQSQQSYATSDNVLMQALLPSLIDVLNTTREADYYIFNSDNTYSQYWVSTVGETTTNLKEDGEYLITNKNNLTLTYTEIADDGQSSIKTGAYKIVSLSDTQLVLYKDLLGDWGALAAGILSSFDKIKGFTPQSAYQIITYSKYEAKGAE